MTRCHFVEVQHPPKSAYPKSCFVLCFSFFFWTKLIFPTKRSTCAYSTSYILWKLVIWRIIWAIRKHFLSILRGITFLLTQWDAYENSILHCVLTYYLCVKLLEGENFLLWAHIWNACQNYWTYKSIWYGFDVLRQLRFK